MENKKFLTPSEGIGNSGGPGKPEDTHIGASGGPGMMPETAHTYSGTGGTGASGLGGGVGKVVSSILDMDESVDDFAKKVAVAGLYGATGGEGQPGSFEDATQEDASLSALAKKYIAQIEQTEDIDKIVRDFNECEVMLEVVTYKTNAIKAYFALIQGTRLLKFKSNRTQQNKHDWVKWAGNKFPNLKKRSREMYMSMASFPGAEYHLAYGLGCLAEFGTLYSNMNDEEKALMGSNPFEKHMLEHGIDLENSTYEERKLNIDSVLEVTKLEKSGVSFPKEAMVSFLRVEHKLTSEERKHLKKLHEEDPQKPIDLLMLIVAKKLERKNLIAGTDTPPPAKKKGGSDKDGSSNAAGKEPNIDKLVATLCVSLKPVASKGVGAENAINRASLLELKGYIDVLLAVSETPVEAAE